MSQEFYNYKLMVTIFKTSVTNKKGIKVIKPLLNDLIPNSNWNFDLKDCDKIFRVDKLETDTDSIIQAFKSTGFECVEIE